MRDNIKVDILLDNGHKISEYVVELINILFSDSGDGNNNKLITNDATLQYVVPQ
jgi:hypothetical protein